uniref:Uncharacterized protein n=1 Tax=Peronospora matthiolae TaxID=2874970 RepID=A0AAV1VEQ8_9STRA
MSSSANNSPLRQHAQARFAADTGPTTLNVVTDPFVLREETPSAPGTPEAQDSASCVPDSGSERMDRLEGFLAGMAQQQAQFMKNQLKMQDQMSRNAQAAPTTSYEQPFNGSNAFIDFIRARDRRMRMGSLD